MALDVTKRQNIKVGMLVEVIADEDKETRALTRGFVSDVLSKQSSKSGIKVMLTNGKQGTVQKAIEIDELKIENFKYWNIFFFEQNIYSIWDNKERKYLVINHVNTNSGINEATAFLFSSKEIASKFMAGTRLDRKRFVINPINRKKPIAENFKTLTIEFFRVNAEKKLSFIKLKELEYKFKKMC